MLGSSRVPAGWALSRVCRLWWARSTLPWVWGWPTRPLMGRTPKDASHLSVRQGEPDQREVFRAGPLSLSRAAGRPQSRKAASRASLAPWWLSPPQKAFRAVMTRLQSSIAW